MKKLFILTGLLFALSFTASAQQKKQVALWQQETMDAIGLNEEQQEKINALTKKSLEDIKKIRQDESFSEKEKKDKTYWVYRRRDKAFQKIVTPEQLKKYEELKEAAKNQ